MARLPLPVYSRRGGLIDRFADLLDALTVTIVTTTLAGAPTFPL